MKQSFYLLGMEQSGDDMTCPLKYRNTLTSEEEHRLCAELGALGDNPAVDASTVSGKDYFPCTQRDKNLTPTNRRTF